MDHKETQEEFELRVSDVIDRFKKMALNKNMRGKTLLAISHGDFLRKTVDNLIQPG